MFSYSAKALSDPYGINFFSTNAKTTSSLHENFGSFIQSHHFHSSFLCDILKLRLWKHSCCQLKLSLSLQVEVGRVVVDLLTQSASFHFWFLETQSSSQENKVWLLLLITTMVPVILRAHTYGIPLTVYSPPTLEHTFPEIPNRNKI